MIHTRWRLSAALTALTIALAACGTGAATTTTTQTPVTEPPVTTAAPSTTEAMEDMDDMEEMETSGSPFDALAAAAHHMSGTSAALAGALDEALALDGSFDSPAAQTSVTLGTLLQEHVYLAAIAVDSGLTWGLDSAEFAAAAATLDANSVALADVIGSVAPDQREAFLDLWRAHIGFFVDYTAARAGGDDGGVEQALLDLGGYSAAAGAFFETITGGELPAAAMEESLNGHIETLTAAIDAAVAGDLSVFDNIGAAAHHVVMGSQVIAGGVVAATGMEGSVDDPATQVHVQVATLLQEHVYRAGIAVKYAYGAGLDSEAFAAAAASLDANSVAIADLIGSVAPDQREVFLDQWREHIGFFVDYAVGAISDDPAAIEQARLDLGAYGAAAGAFFENLTGGILPAAAVEESLNGHIDSLGAAIESLAAAFAA